MAFLIRVWLVFFRQDAWALTPDPACQESGERSQRSEARERFREGRGRVDRRTAFFPPSIVEGPVMLHFPFQLFPWIVLLALLAAPVSVPAANVGFLVNDPADAEWQLPAHTATITLRFWCDYSNRACVQANVADRSVTSRYPNSATHACDDGKLFAGPVGGYWLSPPDGAQATTRYSLFPFHRLNPVGFRMVRATGQTTGAPVGLDDLPDLGPERVFFPGWRE